MNLSADSASIGFTWPVVIGFFLGFAFGVGCALAVMYSIYMGGYRAAVKESIQTPPTERFRAALEKASASLPPSGPTHS